jgi:hypothetical protein
MDLDKILPKFDELPSFHDFKGCAWGLWGADDQLGTINLLTEDVVARAAKEEIQCVQALSSDMYDILTISQAGQKCVFELVRLNRIFQNPKLNRIMQACPVPWEGAISCHDHYSSF